MVPIIRFLYNCLAVPVLHTIFFFGKFFQPKMAERVRGVQQTWKTLQQLPAPSGRRLWFHAASMGEFEQAKPIIEYIRRHDPSLQIIVSFFSPSGYNHQKFYAYADAVVYLPLDSVAEARRFVALLQPDAAVFVRYDIWINHLTALRDNNVPAFLICATLHQKSWMMHVPLLFFTRSAYELFTTIFTAGESETIAFQKLAIHTSIVTTADTRFDRIIERVDHARKHPALPKDIFTGQFVLVAGSTWEADEELLIPTIEYLQQNKQPVRLILVPHEPDSRTITRLRARLPDALLLSEMENQFASDSMKNASPVIIVDSIGKLLALYCHADCAYIGGGFGAGVHSVTEPAGYGIPLACGPRIERARDAIALEKERALTVVRSQEDCRDWLMTILQNQIIRSQQGDIARKYIVQRTGFSRIIAEHIMATGNE